MKLGKNVIIFQAARHEFQYWNFISKPAERTIPNWKFSNLVKEIPVYPCISRQVLRYCWQSLAWIKFKVSAVFIRLEFGTFYSLAYRGLIFQSSQQSASVRTCFSGKQLIENLGKNSEIENSKFFTLQDSWKNLTLI